MRDFRKKRGNNAYFYLFFLILIVFSILIISSLFDLIKKNKEVKINKEAALAELSRLEEREKNISRKLSKIGTTLGTEEAIREKFGFKKPGEGEVIITENKDANETVEKKRRGFLNFLKSLF